MTVRFSCFDTLQLTWLFRRFVSDRSTFAIDNYTSTESAVVGLTFEGAVMTSGLGWRRDMRALLEDRESLPTPSASHRSVKATMAFEVPAIETSTAGAFDGEVALLLLGSADFYSSALCIWLCATN